MTNENKRNFTFDEMPRIYDSQIERKLDSPLTKVPTSYVCNRCKGRGHYVGECPTNEDPTYDMVAGTDYVCKFCKQRATHYFLFCPKNPDPNSIYRRRQEKARQSVPQSNLHNNKEQCKISRTVHSAMQPSPTAGSTIRAAKPQCPRANFQRFANSERKGLREATTGMLRLGKGDEDIEPDSDDASTMSNQSRDGSKSKTSTIGPSEILQSADSEHFWEILADEIETNRSRGARKHCKTLAEIPITEQMECTLAAPVATDQSPYAETVSKLFTNHPNQVNSMHRPRITALDMWDMHDRKGNRVEVDEKPTLSEQRFSFELRTPESTIKNDLREYFDHEVHVSICTDRESNTGQAKRRIDHVGFNVDMSEQNESPTHRQKLRAIRRKINSIENLKSKLESGDDVDSSAMERMANGDLSQEILDNLASQLQTQDAPFKP